MRPGPALPCWWIGAVLCVADCVFLALTSSGVHVVTAVLVAAGGFTVAIGVSMMVNAIITRWRWVAARQWVTGMQRLPLVATPTDVGVAWWLVDCLEQFHARRNEFPDDCLMAAYSAAVTRLQDVYAGDSLAGGGRDVTSILAAATGSNRVDQLPDPLLTSASAQPYLAAVRAAARTRPGATFATQPSP